MKKKLNEVKEFVMQLSLLQLNWMSQQIFQKSTQMFLSQKGMVHHESVKHILQKEKEQKFIYDSYGEHFSWDTVLLGICWCFRASKPILFRGNNVSESFSLCICASCLPCYIIGDIFVSRNIEWKQV